MTRNEESLGLSGKEAVILESLLSSANREMYGLELVSESAGALKRGTVYVTLSRMEDKGYVQSRLEEREAGAMGLPRRLYRVTGYGQRVYEAWQVVKDARNSLWHPAEGLA
jgi:DNA-binding PadR family transcriptional regulator